MIAPGRQNKEVKLIEMKPYFIFVWFLLIVATNGLAKDGKDDKKNQKAVEKEENLFDKNLRKNPNSAGPYLEHANNLAAMPSESARAGAFYDLALKMDSASAEIYKDYGIYLSDRMHAYSKAKELLMKAIALSAGDAETRTHIDAINKIIAVQEGENKLRDFGTSAVKEKNPGGNAAALNKFDSLKGLALTTGNPYYYHALLKRFLTDDRSLNAEDMFMLILGYSAQPTYNAFSYNDINEMKMKASGNIDDGISFGLELVKVNPLNPTLNRELMYYYRKKDHPAEADKYLRRVQQFFNGVLWSGNGSCERPYISLWSKEEYNFLTFIGFKATETHYMGQCASHMAEIIDAVNLSTQKTEPVHFNVGLIYMQTVGK